MKTVIFSILLLAMALPGFAAHQYTIDYGDRNRNGSIRILSDIDSFSFASDFGNVGGSAQLGFYTYSDDINHYKPGDGLFSKGDASVDLGKLAAGENVGFFLQRKNGDILSDFYFRQDGDRLYLTFEKNSGHGRDESLLIGNINVSSPPVASGQPLPGILSTLLLGAGAIGYCMFRKSRKK